jgi:excisionase family DNA binding protein
LDTLLTPVKEACRLLSCSRSTLYELIKVEDVKVRKLGRKTMIETASLRELVARLPTKLDAV